MRGSGGASVAASSTRLMPPRSISPNAVGQMDRERDDEALGVHEDVAPAPDQLLGSVIRATRARCPRLWS
jgi:hypothetical protein